MMSTIQAGGMNDFKDSFDTLEEATIYCLDHRGYDYYTIYDILNRELICL